LQMLEEKMRERELNHRTKWRSFVKAVREDPRYYNLVG
jgi:FF domain